MKKLSVKEDLEIIYSNGNREQFECKSSRQQTLNYKIIKEQQQFKKGCVA